MLLLYVVDRMNLRIDHILPSINSRITLLSGIIKLGGNTSLFPNMKMDEIFIDHFKL